MDNNQSLLGSYPVEDNMIIHVSLNYCNHYYAVIFTTNFSRLLDFLLHI